MELELISKINDLCPDNQGVFIQPSMIPVVIKEHVIYSRYETGGYSGGNCWNDNEPSFYTSDISIDRFKVLDLVLEQLKPSITYLQFKKIEKMIHTNEETEYEYYGNSTEWKVEYIILSELEKYLSGL